MKNKRKPRLASASHARVGRVLTLIGYFGLLALIVNWFTWLAPPVQVPRAMVLAVLALPLLFALRGILHARRYTHQWVNFLAMFYFLIGVDVGYRHSGLEQWLGVLMIVFSLLLFVGSVMYARYTPTPAWQRKSTGAE